MLYCGYTLYTSILSLPYIACPANIPSIYTSILFTPFGSKNHPVTLRFPEITAFALGFSKYPFTGNKLGVGVTTCEVAIAVFVGVFFGVYVAVGIGVYVGVGVPLATMNVLAVKEVCCKLLPVSFITIVWVPSGRFVVFISK